MVRSVCIIYRDFRFPSARPRYSFRLCHSTSFRTRKLPPSGPSFVSHVLLEKERERKVRGCECYEMQGRIILQIFCPLLSPALPPGPSFNPVTPAAISSRESNQVSLKTDENRYVFPERASERASEERTELSPGFSSALRRRDVDYY